MGSRGIGSKKGSRQARWGEVHIKRGTAREWFADADLFLSVRAGREASGKVRSHVLFLVTQEGQKDCGPFLPPG